KGRAEIPQCSTLLPSPSHVILSTGPAAPQPDSEDFRFSPRTCPAGRWRTDRAEIRASGYDRRRSTMNEQAVQERRGRGLNIAEVVFYSVLVLLILLLSVYVPA